MLSTDEALAHVARVRSAGGRVVFTNGVFDLLHPGHLRYLKQARALGNTLIVGINTDRSVRVIKGETRPVTPEHERAEMLAAMECVDAVVLFDEETPYELIKRLQPDVIVKGADWSEASMIGRDIVEARGGQVVRTPIESGYSTTGMIARIKALT
jgi:D-beta-D-heptose 7-phosphate kinase/D-beta-D-heptose 1-phosphate adenosyltransferase